MNGVTKSFDANAYISIALLLAVVSAAVWINRSLDKLDFRMTKMEEHQSRPDPWTGNDQFRWSIELKKLNPHLDVPEPKHKSEL